MRRTASGRSPSTTTSSRRRGRPHATCSLFFRSPRSLRRPALVLLSPMCLCQSQRAFSARRAHAQPLKLPLGPCAGTERFSLSTLPTLQPGGVAFTWPRPKPCLRPCARARLREQCAITATSPWTPRSRSWRAPWPHSSGKRLLAVCCARQSLRPAYVSQPAEACGHVAACGGVQQRSRPKPSTLRLRWICKRCGASDERCCAPGRQALATNGTVYARIVELGLLSCKRPHRLLLRPPPVAPLPSSRASYVWPRWWFLCMVPLLVPLHGPACCTARACAASSPAHFRGTAVGLLAGRPPPVSSSDPAVPPLPLRGRRTCKACAPHLPACAPSCSRLHTCQRRDTRRGPHPAQRRTTTCTSCPTPSSCTTTTPPRTRHAAQRFPEQGGRLP